MVCRLQVVWIAVVLTLASLELVLTLGKWLVKRPLLTMPWPWPQELTWLGTLHLVICQFWNIS